MDPHNPVDPDDVLPQEAAGKQSQNRSDTEPAADTQPAALAPKRPMADPEGDDSGAPDRELIDDLEAVDSDPRALPSATEARESNLGSNSSDGADLGPNDATPEPPAAFFDSTPAATTDDASLDAEQGAAVEPVNAPPLDLIQPPGNRSSDSSAELAAPQGAWPESNAEVPAVGTPASQPSFDLGNAGARAATAPMDSIADYVGPLVEPNASHERKFDDGGKHGHGSIADVTHTPSDPQPETAPVKQKEDANLRAEIDRFIESFNDYSSRTRALLSPAPDGGPPMARPIVLVSLAEEQMQGITNEALAESGSRLAKTAAEVAEDKVNEAFWLRDCEMRALYRGR